MQMQIFFMVFREHLACLILYIFYSERSRARQFECTVTFREWCEQLSYTWAMSTYKNG